MKKIFVIILLYGFGLSMYAQNLLTNGSFENGSFGIGHGDFYLPGWHGYYYGYNWASTSSGGASEGNQKVNFGTGSYIETDDASLVSVTPGNLYKLKFDLQTYTNPNPGLYLGTYGYIIFYDAGNNAIKTEFTQSLQDDGVFPWQSFELYAVAPTGAVKARVKIDASIGVYPNSDFRWLNVDNVVFSYVAEDADRLMVRSAPKMVEPDKSYKLVVRYAATANENLTVELKNGSTSYGVVTKAVNKGRGLVEVTYPVPSNVTNSTSYTWNVKLPAKTITISNVFVNQVQSGSGNIDADNANIVYTGRIDFTNSKAPVLYWFGSEIKTCFAGTSIAIKSSSSPTGYGGYVDLNINYVIDDDNTNIKTATINGANVTTSLATGLSNTTHTIRIMKADESADGTFTFGGFVLDSGKGLLKPDVAGDRKIEFFGNSVTSGGNADFKFNGYAPTLARAMHFEPHIISKGGTGVAASWSNMVTLLDYYDKLDFLNVWDVSACRLWDFSSWTPDVIFIGIGHNDQFNDGWKTFTDRYRTLLTNLETKYPNAHIFCSVPLISNPYPMLAAAIKPVLGDHPRVHFRTQLFTDASVGEHPSTAAHQAMVYGDATRWSTAEWIEETMGWGIGVPGASAGNVAPTCSITAPANNATFTAPASITMNASASDADGTINKVEFYQGSTLLGSDTSSPYSFTWTNVTAGTYSLTVKATDNANAVTTSSVVNVTVNSALTIPGKIEAESYNAMNGIQTETTTDTNGGQNVGYLDAGDWMDYNVNVTTGGTYTINYRVAANSAGQLQLKEGSTIIHTVDIPSSGGWQSWTMVSGQATLTAGAHTLRIYVSTPGWNINWLEGIANGTIANPGFEVNGASQTPTGWSESTDVATSFSEAGGYSGSYRLAHWSTNAYTVSTYQTINNLANGTYTLSAWYTGGGGQTTCTLGAKDFGGSTLTVSLAAQNYSWTQKSITGIVVTNNKMTIEIYSQANAGNWLRIDDVSLTKTKSAETGSIVNDINNVTAGSFEVYPLPLSESFTIETKGFKNPLITIYNLQGQVVLKKHINTEVCELSSQSLPKGMYIISVNDGISESYKKVLK